MRSIQYTVFSIQEGLPSSCEYYYLKSLLCVSASLREEIFKVFSAQYSVFRKYTRRGLRWSQGKICDNLRNTLGHPSSKLSPCLWIDILSLLPTAYCLLPQSKSEFAS